MGFSKTTVAVWPRFKNTAHNTAYPRLRFCPQPYIEQLLNRNSPAQGDGDEERDCVESRDQSQHKDRDKADQRPDKWSAIVSQVHRPSEDPRQIFEKLQVNRRTEAVAKARELGLLYTE